MPGVGFEVELFRMRPRRRSSRFPCCGGGSGPVGTCEDGNIMEDAYCRGLCRD